MTKGTSSLNQLYAAYTADRESGLEPLLAAVRRRAVAFMGDEDAAQEFAVEVWQQLPTLKVRSSFTGWLATRLRWRNVDRHRENAVEADFMQQVPQMIGEDGQALSEDEALGALQYAHLASTGQLAEDLDEEQPERDPSALIAEIDDPVVRQTASLILLGSTQQQAAVQLGMKPGTLRQRLRRYRESHADLLERAA